MSKSRATGRIGDLCEQVRGVTYAKDEALTAPAAGYVPILRAGNISEGSLISDDLIYVPAARVSSKQRLQRNDVLIATSSGSLDVVGKAAKVVSAVDTSFGAFCKVLRPNKRVDPNYFAHFFQTQIYRQRVSSLAAGANINNLRSQHLDDLTIDLPPIDEQRRIAAILDKADAIRSKRREAIAKLDQLLQSVFLNMFGDPVSNPMKWPVWQLVDLTVGKTGVKAGPFGSTLKKEFYAASGYRVYGQEQVIAGRLDIGDYYIDAERFERLKSCAVAAGDLLISLVGTYGKTLIVPEGFEPGIINPRLLKVAPNLALVRTEYLQRMLAVDSVQRSLTSSSHGGTMGILNAGILKALSVPVPPLKLQFEFIERQKAILSLAASTARSLGGIESLAKGLEQSAFEATI